MKRAEEHQHLRQAREKDGEEQLEKWGPPQKWICYRTKGVKKCFNYQPS